MSRLHCPPDYKCMHELYRQTGFLSFPYISPAAVTESPIDQMLNTYLNTCENRNIEAQVLLTPLQNIASSTELVLLF